MGIPECISLIGEFIMIYLKTHKLCILFLCICFAVNAFGKDVRHSTLKCILPSLDGENGEYVTHANAWGEIVKKTNSTITMKQNGTNKNVLIKLNKKTELYTVFGGDAPLDVLKPGHRAWVWYNNCKKPVSNTNPVAAMIFIYTTDPNDIDPEWEEAGDYPWVDRCIFPEPDGSNVEYATQANAWGKIVKKTNSTIIIKQKHTNKDVLIKLNKMTELYSVLFGGETAPLDDLKPGIVAWVWYKNCKRPDNNTSPVAAMIFVYSINPNTIDRQSEEKEDYPWIRP